MAFPVPVPVVVVMMLGALVCTSCAPLTAQAKALVPSSQEPLVMDEAEYDATIPMLQRVSPFGVGVEDEWSWSALFDSELFNSLPASLAVDYPDMPYMIVPDASNSTQTDAIALITKYFKYGDGANISEENCSLVASAMLDAGLNTAAFIPEPYGINPLFGSTYHAFGETLGWNFAGLPTKELPSVSEAVNVVALALVGATRYGSALGIHHGWAWQIVTDMPEEPTKAKLVDVCPDSLGVANNCWHGAGHGSFLWYTPNNGNGPCPAAKTTVNDANALATGLDLCHQVAQGSLTNSFRGFQCADGAFHSFEEWFNHSSYWQGGGNGAWAFPCAEDTTYFRQGCFRWINYLQTYYNSGLYDYLTGLATTHVSSDCFEPTFAETVVRACIMGQSSVMYSIYDWMLLAPDSDNMTAKESCETHPFFPAITSLADWSFYCEVLLRDQPTDLKTVSTTSTSTLVSWCSYYVEPSETPRYLTQQESMRWYACVLGTQHHIRDEQERFALNQTWSFDEPTSEYLEQFYTFRSLRFYECKPLLAVSWQLNHTMRQESFRLCMSFWAGWQEVPWFQDESAPYSRVSTPVVPDEYMRMEELLELAETL